MAEILKSACGWPLRVAKLPLSLTWSDRPEGVADGTLVSESLPGGEGRD